MTPERAALVDALEVERFTVWPRTPSEPAALVDGDPDVIAARVRDLCAPCERSARE